MEEEKDLNLTELTQYQLRFIDEYMKCGNKREAMMKCGYKGKGKRSTVTSSAAKLYNLPKVQAKIERRRRELAEENLIDSKAIVKRLTKMINGELTSEFVTKQGQVVDVPITFKNQIDAAKKRESMRLNHFFGNKEFGSALMPNITIGNGSKRKL